MTAGGAAKQSGGKPAVALGIVASSTPPAALLSVLRELRPEFDVRLQRLSDASGIETLYRVEVALRGPAEAGKDIDLWLRIKSVLVAAFPAGKPGAVTAIDP